MLSSGINRKAAERADNEPLAEADPNDRADAQSAVVT
jgi:hypothetical protein